MVEADHYLPDGPSYFTNMASTPDKYLYESNGIRRGMSTISWIREIIGSDADKLAQAQAMSTENYLNSLAATIPPGCEGLLTIPEWLAPPQALYKRGIMLGFSGRTTAVHMYRSIMEAIALTMGGNLKQMAQDLSIPLKEVVVSGGGSNGDLFMSIIADVLGLPTRRTEVNGAVGLGAAICASLAVKLYHSLPEALEAMVHFGASFLPNEENHLFYQRLYDEVYRDLTLTTDPLLAKVWQVFQPASPKSS
jgi:sugar (pentulose or hexulose) kinase